MIYTSIYGKLALNGGVNLDLGNETLYGAIELKNIDSLTGDSDGAESTAAVGRIVLPWDLSRGTIQISSALGQLYVEVSTDRMHKEAKSWNQEK